MKNHSILIIIFFTLFFGCKTSPLVEPEINIQNGIIIVTSNIEDARIFVDGNFSGKLTPDTLNVQTGTRIISLEKEGYASNSFQIIVMPNSVNHVNIVLNETQIQKTILIEEFSNISCVPCVTTNLILKSFSNSFTRKELLIIKYPANFPYPNDIFYNSNPSACNARINYYNVMAAPTVVVDGILRPSPADSNKIKERIFERLDINSKFKLNVKDSIAAGNYFIEIDVELLNNTGLNFSELIIKTVVIERKIEFPTPPGGNGETEFHNVMRALLPSNNGESISLIENQGKLKLSRNIDINSNWNINQIATVVFIQNKTTKEIFQSSSTFN